MTTEYHAKLYAHELGRRHSVADAGKLAAALLDAQVDLHRLTVNNGNRFTRLPSAEESIAQMRDLASPIGAFAREECDEQAGYEIEVDMLYGAFKVWAENNGHTKKLKAGSSAATYTPPSPRSESHGSGAPKSAGASIPESA